MATQPLDSAQLGHFKDAILEDLATEYNVAQFVSFAPGLPLAPRFVRIKGVDGLHEPDWLISELLESSADQSVNIRSFDPLEPKSRDFIYGLTSLDDVVAALSRIAEEGLFTIVNETIDIHDGGISGVSYGGIFEFAPDDTPRCVESPGTASLSTIDALSLIRSVYRVSLDEALFPSGIRLEFSIHPLARGLKDDHLIVWEAEEEASTSLQPMAEWPNRFSRFLGDKTFGLLVADQIGLPVPFTTVLHRRLAPFSFGIPTGSSETWLRTAPAEPVPGFFTTQRGWTDPLKIWNEEEIASILAQQAVETQYAGALLVNEQGEIVIEGSKGDGEAFMLGDAGPVSLPPEVHEGVLQLCKRAQIQLGPVRMEWGFDGERFWVFQLHRGASLSNMTTIVPGEASNFNRFDVSLGILKLRALVEEVGGTGEGIALVGDVGVTSHLGDILRRAGIPSFVERLPAN